MPRAAPTHVGAEAHGDRPLAANSVARLILPAADLFRADGDTFHVRFRLENLTDADLFVDLASPTLVAPRQWGPLATESRMAVDERRYDVGPLTDEERERLRAAAGGEGWVELPAHGELEFYVPFRGTGAQMFTGFATPWVFVSLDGAVDVVDEHGNASRLSLAWRDGRGPHDTDVVHRMPVMLAERDCRRERRITPRDGRDEWPVFVCRARRDAPGAR